MQVVTFLPTITSGPDLESAASFPKNGKEGAFHRNAWTTRLSLEYVQPFLDTSKTHTWRGVVTQAETQTHRHLLWQILLSEYDSVTSQQKIVHFTLVVQGSSLTLIPKAGIIPSQFHPTSILTTYFPKIHHSVIFLNPYQYVVR